MSGSSYRLETPRARPPPLLVDKSSYNSSTSILGGQHNSEPLLYNLPAARSMSPPASPRSRATSPRSPRSRLTSPTSPTFGRSRTPVNGRPTPSPSRRNRSATPSGVASSELDQFAEYCRAWYFTQDDNSGRLMTQTLANLPSSQRAPYSRLQASIRSAYHRSVNARRTAEFRAHLSATQPGGSLLPHARANPHGNVARKGMWRTRYFVSRQSHSITERYERFERFVRAWCTMGMPGPQPFFQTLWAIMRLQIVPEGIGGRGGIRFNGNLTTQYYGRLDFMIEAIDCLKGVLAFEETPSSKRASSAVNYDIATAATVHARSKSTPISSQSSVSAQSRTAQPKRARAPSDPFLDTPALSGSLSSSPSSGTSALLITPTTEEAPPSGAAFYADDPQSSLAFDDSDEEFLRIWTSSDLPNPEFIDLLAVFPTFITRRALPRFPVASVPKDLEEGFDVGDEGKVLRFGTGSMWVSSIPRSDGWKGGWWTQFCMWWKQVFC
ncbi:hypothetical protein B0H17DRAFT_1175843 [Mycena rosella]|uniref:Uncharacterized protein n=1 Tax=Mycena rosella TaxID=1033263 RepID=A0AAD7GR18_MYCRO|nr:hypothetical protein B0H17DRAFT_1175843 [Mycena rosella]